jgi:ABC-type oligopeptide transport system substrate-binding subunit
MNRRTLLGSTLLAIATRPLTWPRWISGARADDKSWRHGVSLFDDVKYPAGFRHFEYVNPDSPKGGTTQQMARLSYRCRTAVGQFSDSVELDVRGRLSFGGDT